MSHIYRYRNPGVLSTKEILYNEIYLASDKELNDPIDLLPNFTFEAGSKDIWHRIFLLLNAPSYIAEMAAEYYESLCPIEYHEIITKADRHHEELTKLILKKHELSKNDNLRFIVQAILSNLMEFITKHKPSSGYSASFSEVSDSMLMWSHYTNSHYGFCLVFRPINNEIQQCPNNSKTQVKLGGNNEHIISIKSAFELEKVNYKGVDRLNAFHLMPQIVTGIDLFEDNYCELFWNEKRQQMLSKNSCWEYEQERRVFLWSPTYSIAKQEKIKKIDQLFYYNAEQLVGVIFGARMISEDKNTIRDIIKRKIDSTYDDLFEENRKKYLFDFHFQQAVIDNTCREIKILPLEIISNGNLINHEHADYRRLLEDWRNGKGRIAYNKNIKEEDIPW